MSTPIESEASLSGLLLPTIFRSPVAHMEPAECDVPRHPPGHELASGREPQTRLAPRSELEMTKRAAQAQVEVHPCSEQLDADMVLLAS